MNRLWKNNSVYQLCCRAICSSWYAKQLAKQSSRESGVSADTSLVLRALRSGCRWPAYKVIKLSADTVSGSPGDMHPPVCFEYDSTVGQFVHITPLNKNLQNHSTWIYNNGAPGQRVPRTIYSISSLNISFVSKTHWYCNWRHPNWIGIKTME